MYLSTINLLHELLALARYVYYCFANTCYCNNIISGVQHGFTVPPTHQQTHHSAQAFGSASPHSTLTGVL